MEYVWKRQTKKQRLQKDCKIDIEKIDLKKCWKVLK